MMDIRNEPPPFTVEELAARWSKSPAGIRNMIHNKELEAFRCGKVFRIPSKVVAKKESAWSGTDTGSSTTGRGANTMSIGQTASEEAYIPMN